MCKALTLHGVAAPTNVTFQPVLVILPTSMAIPWGNAIGPLQLGANNDLPRASQKNFPKFNGDGKISVDEHIAAFFIACSNINPQHEDIAVMIFVEIWVENATD